MFQKIQTNKKIRSVSQSTKGAGALRRGVLFGLVQKGD